MNALVSIGLAILFGGIAGIYFITLPSIYGIGDGAEAVANNEVGKGVSQIIIGGIILWITTGLFICGIVAGGVLTAMGALD